LGTFEEGTLFPAKPFQYLCFTGGRYFGYELSTRYRSNGVIFTHEVDPNRVIYNDSSSRESFNRVIFEKPPRLTIRTEYINSNYREYYKIKSSADVIEKDEFVAKDSLGETLRVSFL